MDFGGVEHGDAAIERIVDLRVAVGFRVLLAVGHSAEADGADLDAASAKLAILHAPKIGFSTIPTGLPSSSNSTTP